MNAPNIVVLQTGIGGITLVSRVLQEIKLVRGEDFVTFDRTGESLEAAIYNSFKPQLLIVGSFGGEMTNVVPLVRRLRAKNPSLTAFFVDSLLLLKDPPEFDDVVCMNNEDWAELLFGLVKSFQEGSLRHDPFKFFAGGMVQVDAADGGRYDHGILSTEIRNGEILITPWWSSKLAPSGFSEEIDPVPVVVGKEDWRPDPRHEGRLEITNPEQPAQKSFFIPRRKGPVMMLDGVGIESKKHLPPPKV